MSKPLAIGGAIAQCYFQAGFRLCSKVYQMLVTPFGLHSGQNAYYAHMVGILLHYILLIQSNLFKRELFRRDFALSGTVALLFGRPIQNCMDKRDSENCKRDSSLILAGVYNRN